MSQELLVLVTLGMIGWIFAINLQHSSWVFNSAKKELNIADLFYIFITSSPERR